MSGDRLLDWLHSEPLGGVGTSSKALAALADSAWNTATTVFMVRLLQPQDD
jgi:hypothetical protein